MFPLKYKPSLFAAANEKEINAVKFRLIRIHFGDKFLHSNIVLGFDPEKNPDDFSFRSGNFKAYFSFIIWQWILRKCAFFPGPARNILLNSLI